jgi:hypothetical protein
MIRLLIIILLFLTTIAFGQQQMLLRDLSSTIDFVPTDEDSLFLWIDGDDTTNCIHNNGSAIDSITDLSGKDHSVTLTTFAGGAITYATNILNGRGAIKLACPVLNDWAYLVFGSTTSTWKFLHYEKATVFMVVEPTPGVSNPGNLHYLFQSGFTPGMAIWVDDTGPEDEELLSIVYSNASAAVAQIKTGDNAFAFDEAHLVTIWFDNQNGTVDDRMQVTIDGTDYTSVISTASASSTNPALQLQFGYGNTGGFFLSDWHIHELIICKDKLSAGRISDFVTYLENKWGSF